jgi:hypothetical protein
VAGAFIYYDSSRTPLSLPSLRRVLEEAGYRCAPGQWRYPTEVVEQLHVQTSPPFALQVDEADEIVSEEIDEMLEDEDLALPEESIARLRVCNARLEVVSTEQPVIEHTAAGGVVSYTPEPDLSSAEVQSALAHLTENVHGVLWRNE